MQNYASCMTAQSQRTSQLEHLCLAGLVEKKINSSSYVEFSPPCESY